MKHSTISLARQPILNRNRQVVAYELLFRDGACNRATIVDDFSATACVITQAFDQLGSGAVLGNYRGFINMDAELLMSNIVESLPKEQVVLELLETIAIDEQIIDRCHQLKQLGYCLALDDFVQHHEEHDALLEIVDIVKVDVLPLHHNQLDDLVHQLAPWHVKLLAEKVESAEGVCHCGDLGFDLYQGFYFAPPTPLAA